jgi:hypothetical protein
MSHDPYAALYDRGIAPGQSHVKTDTMTFRFRDETFEFPTLKVHPFTYWNGYFYEARIDDLRKLEAEAASG